ncbi:MAG: ABC transporter ATP-binding protein [Euryarchaeota archaeon RBG_16_68_13]|nr:MAG: ABC transporter ATP-binding protein [Euryarchaeota archaeon RBG_16_68_13]
MVGIELKDVIKVYRTGDLEVIALRGVTASIPSVRAVALMGPSGCGKSTLLNLVAGLDRCTAGSIVVDGKNITRLPEADLVRHRRDTVGIVFQFFNLVPTLTALENVELPMRLRSKPAEDRERRARELLRLIGLEARAEHRPDAMSGGEQQRVAIAVALANDPPILLADEPTGELDSENGRRVLELLRDVVREQGKTVVVATHDPRITDYVTTVLQMADGKIVET